MSREGDPAEIERATVLICSRDRPEMVLDTVRSVLEGDTVPAEIVVVDQSSVENPALAELGAVRGCRVCYRASATAGLSRGRNVGLRAASEDVVVLLDDDMFVAADWLGTLLGGLPDHPRGVATGRVLAAPEEGAGGTVPAAALVQRTEPAVYRGPQSFDVVPGANVALRRDTVLALGGYDERLGAGTRFASADDNDMGHRLLQAGCEVRFAPAAVVYHRAWREPGELVRLRWGYGRGKGAFYAKHAGLRDRRMLRRATIEAARRVKRAARALPASPRGALAELVSLLGMISGGIDWVVRERLPAIGKRRRP